MIPLAHDFTGETVLVFGGGSVGARKARRFDREARVIVVSPRFDAGDEADDDGDGEDGTGDAADGCDDAEDDAGAYGDATLVRAAPDADDVAGWIDRVDPALVVAATDDPELNAAVDAAAREAGVLVNRTDRSGSRRPGSVAVPATVRDGPVTVAIATDGTAPALSRHLRRRFADDIEGVGALATALAALRERLAAGEGSPGDSLPAAERRAVLREVVDSSRVWTALGDGTTNVEQVVTDVARDTRGDSS